MPQRHVDDQLQTTRRGFVIAGTGITAASLASLASVDSLLAQTTPHNAPAAGAKLIEPNKTILFQGDSITDAGRDRKITGEPNSFAAMGKGYAWMAASQMLVDSPDAKLKIFNRGISGDKVYQLADRWQADCLDIKPDLLSILVGVNDFAHVFRHGYKGTVEKYEEDYHALIKRTKEALPTVKLVICEPFILICGMVDETWVEGFAKYRAAAKRVADEAGAKFVPFQTMFDTAAKIAPPDQWAADGVHPTTNGAALMAHWWLKAVGA
jgi:lysophospholipase L1-like esterase